jgi:hypothetical protein
MMAIMISKRGVMVIQAVLKIMTAVSVVVCIGCAKANYLRHKRQMPPFFKFTFGDRFSVTLSLIYQCERYE